MVKGKLCILLFSPDRLFNNSQEKVKNLSGVTSCFQLFPLFIVPKLTSLLVLQIYIQFPPDQIRVQLDIIRGQINHPVVLLKRRVPGTGKVNRYADCGSMWRRWTGDVCSPRLRCSSGALGTCHGKRHVFQQTPSFRVTCRPWSLF